MRHWDPQASQRGRSARLQVQQQARHLYRWQRSLLSKMLKHCVRQCLLTLTRVDPFQGVVVRGVSCVGSVVFFHAAPVGEDDAVLIYFSRKPAGTLVMRGQPDVITTLEVEGRGDRQDCEDSVVHRQSWQIQTGLPCAAV